MRSTFDMPLVNSIYAPAAQESRAIGVPVLSTLVLGLNREARSAFYLRRGVSHWI